MKFRIHPQYLSMAGKPVYKAFVDSLLETGYELVNDDSSHFEVIWSVLWNGRMAGNKQVWDHCRSINKPVIVLEVGGLKRNETWKVGINGINRDAYFGNIDCPPDRFEKLGLDLKPWHDGEHIIICGQHGKSEQWKYNKPVNEWMTETALRLRNHTDRKIILRPHPRFPLKFDKIIDNCQMSLPNQLEGTYDDFDFSQLLKNAHAVINYSSNPGIESVLAGVPVYVSSHSLCYDVGNDINDFSNIERPAKPDRAQWANNIAYTEWTIGEIRAGHPFSRLVSELDFLVHQCSQE